MGSAGDSLPLANGLTDLMSSDESELGGLEKGKSVASRRDHPTSFVINKISKDGATVGRGAEGHVVQRAIVHCEREPHDDLIFVTRSGLAMNRERGVQREI
jgi:hypothetical protein